MVLKKWIKNGKYHRIDGPAIIYPTGYKVWFLNGNRHREDGPALIHSDGTKKWYFNGELHRKDGPAVIYADETNTQQWYVHGLETSFTQWIRIMKSKLPYEEISRLLLIYG